MQTKHLMFALFITIAVVSCKKDSSTASTSATVSISGATTGGKSFSYTATLTFNGNKQATLVFGNSNTYNIIWS